MKQVFAVLSITVVMALASPVFTIPSMDASVNWNSIERKSA